MTTKIEFADVSWNPLQDTRKGKSGRGYHCTKCSPGCVNCWAEMMNKRFGNEFPFDSTPVTFEIMPDVLERPLHWRKPRRVVVQFMGDLFHKDVDGYDRADIWSVMNQASRHTFLILTKRVQEMHDWIVDNEMDMSANILPGVTVCNSDELWKLGVLLEIPAAKHWMSLEPMLEEIDPHLVSVGYRILSRWYGPDGFDETGSQPERERPRPDWVVLGGETGPGARPMHFDWARDVRDQCVETGTPFLFKGWGNWFPRDQWEHNPELVLSDDDVVYQSARTHIFPDGSASHRIGKKRAGRLLDGETWDQYPE